MWESLIGRTCEGCYDRHVNNAEYAIGLSDFLCLVMYQSQDTCLDSQFIHLLELTMPKVGFDSLEPK